MTDLHHPPFVTVRDRRAHVSHEQFAMLQCLIYSRCQCAPHPALFFIRSSNTKKAEPRRGIGLGSTCRLRRQGRFGRSVCLDAKAASMRMLERGKRANDRLRTLHRERLSSRLVVREYLLARRPAGPEPWRALHSERRQAPHPRSRTNRQSSSYPFRFPFGTSLRPSGPTVST